MVDCGAAQCVQKKRTLKKELLAWTKKVPILVGAEEAASILIGRRRAKYLLEPLRKLESSEPTDWQPQLTCSFCDAKTKFTLSLVKERDEAIRAGIPLPPSYHNLLTMFPPSHCNHGNNRFTHTDPPMTTMTQMMYDPDEPLDLSASSSTARRSPHIASSARASAFKHSGATASSLSSSSPLKVPHIELKLGKHKSGLGVREGGKRGYTEQELSAAVTDIRSGKLGTRRAAALYGIPRSTLRNKICRMESNGEHASSTSSPGGATSCLPPGSATPPDPPGAPPPPPPPLPTIPGLGMPDLLQQHLTAAAAMGMWYPPPPPPSAGDQWLAAAAMAAAADSTWQHKLQTLRKKHDLNAGLDRPFGMPPLFFNSPPFLPFDLSLDKSALPPYEEKLPFLQDLVRKFAEQRVEMERSDESSSEVGKGPEDLSAKPLKVPSFKRSASEEDEAAGLSASMTSLPESIKDIKSEKESALNASLASSAFFCPFTAATLPFATAYANGVEGFGPPTMDLTLSPLVKKPRVSETKSYPNSGSPTKGKGMLSKEKEMKAASNSSSSASSSPKKTRPKRGQYRRYNHELLMEAVKAVQRGEMSVHRAGSYYGVPHSTLEYKVKERHLMRNKKPAANGVATSARASSTTTSSGNSNNTSTLKKTEPTAERSLSTEDTDDHMSKHSTEDENLSSVSSLSKPASPTPPPATKPNGLKLTPFMLIKDNDEKPSSASPSPAPTDDYLSMLSSFSPSVPPVGFGWPPIFPPTGVPDSALATAAASAAAASYNGSFSSINMSASDLLKQLHQKVENNGSASRGEEAVESGLEPGEVVVK